MKCTLLFSLIILFACNTVKEKDNTAKDTIAIDPGTSELKSQEENQNNKVTPKKYSNNRFKDVTITRTGKDSFLIKGQGQIFEANFNWNVEDGHEELKKGIQMTDAGAPDWGNFEFTIEVQKKRENSTLTLILFESSAKDGSRQNELPIPLK